jgi:hypothetical protein
MADRPVALAQFDERPRIAVLPNGELWGMFVSRGAGEQHVAARRSTDNGNSWSEAECFLSLPADAGQWGGCEVVVDEEGEVHAFLLNDRHTGVFRDPSGEGEIKRLPISDRRLDIWHTQTESGRASWRPPRRIWKGYTGSINSAIQTRAGRIILAFAFQTSRVWGNRGEGLDAFWYAGQSSSTVVYSDDGGASWTLSPSALKVQTPSIGTYGACEPVIIEKEDGTLWMLMRTQVGRFYESFSADGAHWSYPRPTPLINSDSPAGLVRLPDGRMVLLWNKCMRFPYAHGGRHVLHGAISADDGKSWRGHREVARDPLRAEPPPPSGDHGTAYPYPAVLEDGTVLVTTGQGAGRVNIVRIDPQWLCETRAASAFEVVGSSGRGGAEGEANGVSEGGADSPLEEWSIFGCRGVGIAAHPEEGGRAVLSIARVEAEWPAAAVWNFPLGRRGSLRLKIRPDADFGGALMLLTDHFSVPFEPEDALYALFGVWLKSPRGPDESTGWTPGGGVQAGAARNLPSGVLRQDLAGDGWRELELRWDCETRSCALSLDGVSVGSASLLREGDGVCYLRLKSASNAVDGGFIVESVEVEVAD